MVIVDTDIKYFYSGDGTATGSLGGAITANEVTDGNLHNIFDKVLGAESLPGDIEYRCIYVQNKHATITLELAKLYFSSNTPDPANVIDIGLDLAGKNGTADTIVDENTAPSPAVSFSQPTTYGTGLSLGDLAPDDYFAIWFRRTISPSQPAKDAVSFTVEVDGDSSE